MRKNLVLTFICLKVIFLMVVRKKGIDSGLREMGVRFRNFLGVICWYPNKSHWGLCWKFYPVTLISVRNLNTEILSFNFVTCFYPICLIQYVVGTQAMASPIVLLRLWYKAVFRWIWKRTFNFIQSQPSIWFQWKVLRWLKTIDWNRRLSAKKNYRFFHSTSTLL